MEATLPLPADEAAQERPQGPLSQHEPSPATKQASTAGCSSSSRSECWWKRAAAHHLAAVRAVVDKLKRWIWQFIDYLLEVSHNMGLQHAQRIASSCCPLRTPVSMLPKQVALRLPGDFSQCLLALEDQLIPPPLFDALLHSPLPPLAPCTPTPQAPASTTSCQSAPPTWVTGSLSTAPMQYNRHADRLPSRVSHPLLPLAQEFDPWLKWVVFDALLSLVVAALVKRVDSLRPFFETIGWA